MDERDLIRAHLNANKMDFNESNLDWIPNHLNQFMRPLQPNVTKNGLIYVNPKMQGTHIYIENVIFTINNLIFIVNTLYRRIFVWYMATP